MEDFREEIEDVRIRLRLTVLVARYDYEGTAHHVAEYGVHRHDRP